jgi:hypothetical protein
MIQDFVHVFCTDVVVFARFLASPPPGADTASPAPASAVQSPDKVLATMAWSQLGPYAKAAPPWQRTRAAVPGVLKIDATVSLKYDPDQWKPAALRDGGRLAFSHSSGAANALVISEPVAVALDSVEDVALANAQSIDPHATVVFRHRIWSKDVTFWFLKIEATVGNVPMVYWGRFYVTEAGTVQVIVYTEKGRLAEFEQAFTDFLNGVTVSK